MILKLVEPSTLFIGNKNFKAVQVLKLLPTSLIIATDSTNKFKHSLDKFWTN